MRVVNLHPALPGQFPGLNAIERAFDAYQAGQIRSTGVMVHLVPDERVDAGPLVLSEPVPIHPEDNLESLTRRVHHTEHEVLVKALWQLLRDDLAEHTG
jgi:folate-dependent phosphoribosylglycinamide formyltransferase PurN